VDLGKANDYSIECIMQDCESTDLQMYMLDY